MATPGTRTRTRKEWLLGNQRPRAGVSIGAAAPVPVVPSPTPHDGHAGHPMSQQPIISSPVEFRQFGVLTEQQRGLDKLVHSATKLALQSGDFATYQRLGRVKVCGVCVWCVCCGVLWCLCCVFLWPASVVAWSAIHVVG